MSLAALTEKKVLGIKLWVILLVVVLLLVGGFVIVRKVYNKLTNRRRVVETMVHVEPPLQPQAQPEATEIEEVVKTALDKEAYTVDIKEQQKPDNIVNEQHEN